MAAIEIEGLVSVHLRGFGFVTELADPGRSAFVAPPELNRFLAGDRVRCFFQESDDGRFTAAGLTLVGRSRRVLYGVVVSHRQGLFLKVDREVSNTDWALDPGPVEAKVGDAVLAAFHGDSLVVDEVLQGADAQAVARVLARYAIASQFAQAAVDDVARALATPHALGARRDLRAIPTVTIDAASTRDIDDAISVIAADKEGALRLLVSIADVSAFVPEGSALDDEARARATSVYLAGRVIPMFPEALSSSWLSLLPDAERACLTCELRIDPEGQVTSIDVYESLIRSWARLTYVETAAYLDRGEVSAAMEPVRAVLPWFRTVSARLKLARARRGGVEVSRDETRVVFDPSTGTASAIEADKPTSAHVLIERCMVVANEAIAQWLVARGVPGVFRVHDAPSPERVAELGEFARNFGIEPGFSARLSPLALAAFDQQITGLPSEPALRSVFLRTLGPARYTVNPSQHYGLAAPLYLHFTSPIRRYADLVVHRIVRRYLHGERAMTPGDASIEALCVHINERARAAARAETDRRRSLTAAYMATRTGEVFEARVTRVRSFGLWVQLDTTLVEGSIAWEGLAGGPWEADEAHGVARAEGAVWAIGDALRVRVASVDVGAGRVEFAVA
ncbi:MAG: VacB/RNase II family 3'-5' exoribonuclease [Myxococcales bacterium]|nr:VacB/RNase II family 3'-5' exoribonuclease [Myxococcales bacterium]